MSRLPIRVRLTAAFATAMVLVLAGAGLFVYLRLRADLDEGVNALLRDRAAAAQHGVRGIGFEDPDESFAQLFTAAGRLVDSAGGANAPALNPAEIRRAVRGTVVIERRVPGIDTTARLLGRSATAGSARVVVAGQSLGDRDEALSGVVSSFALGGALAIVLASGIGYLLASAGFAPVEVMRRRAREVSLSGPGDRLPLPRSHDEVYRLGETLNEMLDRLERSFERERRFVADASHDLRSPIAVVKTELEGALRTGDYGPAVGESLAAAVEECDRLGQLADDLLVVASAAEGRLPLRRETLDVAPLLESVRDGFSDRARRSGRAIAIDSGEARELSADPLRIRQALGNLVDNALRHGGGEVTLRARSVAGGVALEVSDEGPGFGPELAGRAFERFARGDAARTRGGSGLGLAIVRAIAESHGGRAEIVSGLGATVRVWLPDGLRGT